MRKIIENFYLSRFYVIFPINSIKKSFKFSNFSPSSLNLKMIEKLISLLRIKKFPQSLFYQINCRHEFCSALNKGVEKVLQIAFRMVKHLHCDYISAYPHDCHLKFPSSRGIEQKKNIKILFFYVNLTQLKACQWWKKGQNDFIRSLWQVILRLIKEQRKVDEKFSRI